MKYFLTTIWLVFVLAPAIYAEPTEDATFFEQSIAPLLTTRCAGCHNPTDRKGGFDLTSKEGLKAGGDSGAPLEAGNLEKSLLWQRVADKEMPPKETLTERELDLLRDWVRRGGHWGGG